MPEAGLLLPREGGGPPQTLLNCVQLIATYIMRIATDVGSDRLLQWPVAVAQQVAWKWRRLNNGSHFHRVSHLFPSQVLCALFHLPVPQ